MPTIVLLHALGASRRMWRAQLETLGSEHEVVAPDLPGHGHAPGPFTMPEAVAKVRDVLRDAVGRVHLVGASLGGAVALQVALADRTRVASLLLMGAPLRPPPANVLMQRVVTALLPLASTAALSVRQVAPADRRDADALLDDIVRAGKATQGQALRAIARSDPTERLAEIDVPALVCCGEKDDANLSAARVLAARMPHAELRVVAGTGHLWTLQRPDLCTETIAEFVGSAA